MIINLLYDAQALAAPQSFRDGMQAAADMLEAHLIDNITVNISVGYGELNGTALTSQNVSVGGPGPTTDGSGFDLSYTALRAALASHNTSATDATVLANLTTDPNIEGETDFRIGNAQARALGFVSTTDATVDGGVGMGTNFAGNVLFAGALHELTHAMGRVANWLDVNWSVDLFRFDETTFGGTPTRGLAETCRRPMRRRPISRSTAARPSLPISASPPIPAISSMAACRAPTRSTRPSAVAA